MEMSIGGGRSRKFAKQGPGDFWWMEASNPVQNGAQRLARLSVGTILYQARIGRVQKPALDVLGHVLCQIIESLFRNIKSYTHGTPSLVLYEGFEEEPLVSLRRDPDFVHEASAVLDMAMTCLSVSPTPFLFITGLPACNAWNPGYAAAELLDYARIQVRFGEGQQETLRKMMEQTEASAMARWNRPTDRLPKSIFENSGIINVAYTVIPRPTATIEEVSSTVPSSKQASNESIGMKRQLEAIVEESV